MTDPRVVRVTGAARGIALTRAIAFLCGEDAGFINGAIIDINGGFYMP